MSTLTAIITVALCAATAVLVAGIARKIVQYVRTPAPLKIPTTPAPVTRTGVAVRLVREVVLFESLFKASKWTWLFGWIFHAALLVVLIGHLRYFTEPVWAPVAFIQGIAPYAGLAMIAGLGGLWARRFLVDRVRYISAPSDHLMLALLVAIGGERSGDAVWGSTPTSSPSRRSPWVWYVSTGSRSPLMGCSCCTSCWSLC